MIKIADLLYPEFRSLVELFYIPLEKLYTYYFLNNSVFNLFF